MLSGKIVKLILYEALQLAALGVTVFVVMERFAGLIRDVRGGDVTAYWLVVAASVAYVTSATLLVWVPLKYQILKKRRFITKITQWRPTALAYLILCTLPCFAILIAGSKVQVDSGNRLDHFSELPVSLVLFSLICVDIIERIRPCKLLGHSDSLEPDFDMQGPTLTHLESVTSVSSRVDLGEGQNGAPPSPPDARNGGWQDSGRPTPSMRTINTSYIHSAMSRPRSYSGPLGFLWRRDGRSEVFVDAFLFWLDTVEMVRVAGEPAVYYSVWVFPIYILAFLSTLRVAVTPNNPLLSWGGVALQDLPFLVLRVALIVVFGFVTPLLYPLKNALVTLTFIHFTYLSKLKIFKRHSMF